MLYAQRKGIQSAEILYKVRRCQGCYTAFCSLTVVEHIDQNILTLFVFQRNKMELHFLCVCSLTFHSCLDRCLTEGGTDHLFVCEWVGGLERACVLWVFFFLLSYVISLMLLATQEITALTFCCIVTRILDKGGTQPSQIPVEA